MDELRAFFNDPCPSSSKVIKLRGPLTGGFRITKDDNINELNRREDHRRSVVLSGTDYAREVKERETQAYLKHEAERERWDSISGGLESLEHLSSLGTSLPNIDELTEEAMTEVYSKYSFQMKEDTNNLAINGSKADILDRIRGYPIVVIEGPTGCGKTTQVPQWILDDCYKHRKPCKIIVTQPRRIAAMSIAKRVAQERGWDVGGLVGYQVGLENRTTSDTRIHYVTTGVLLQKLVNTKTMNEYTHIILDEVHERGQDMDFLLLVVKKLHYTVSPKVKIVLMSATFNYKNFANYFDIPTPTGQHMASCIQVKRQNPMFTVKTYYLDGLSKFGSILDTCTPKGEEPVIIPEMYHLVVKLVNAFEQLDMSEHKYADRSEADLPSVLIFLPGINEIEEQYAALTDLELRRRVAGPECPKYKWWVLPLHSTITADEQVRVFQRAPPGHRKVILATNIAESSITVPDIKYVVDFCLMKVLVADEHTNFTSLSLTWASKSNCEQRAGRAGRVRDGRVYRLVQAKFYEGLKQDSTPEIVRCPLERLVLLAKMLDMGAPSDVLALAMDPPDMSNIHRTILVLKEVGALKKTLDNEWSPSDGDITYMGRVMAKLPLDVKVSKIIILGHIFGCLEECIIMAAALSVKNVFSSPFRERLNAYNSKLTWADGSTSDCIAFLYAYKVWNHLRQRQFFKQQGNNEAHWARRFYVQVRALRELDDMVRELKQRLSREGIEPLKGADPWTKNELSLVYKVILAGAFYPQYFVQGSRDEARERDAVRELGGHDPRTTVYLRNFPEHQPGELYAAAIKRVVQQQIHEEPRVSFDTNSRKVFLTFPSSEDTYRRDNNSGDPTIPGQVLLPVYKAVKARQLKMDIRIPLLPLDKANSLAEALSKSRSDLSLDTCVPRLPPVEDTYFPLKISQYVNVSKFWVQYDEETAQSELMQIQAALNRGGLLSYTGDVAPGDVLAAPYTDAQGTRVHRARVQRLLARDTVEVQIQAALNRGGLLSYTGDVAPGDVLAAPYTDAQGTRVHRARVQRLLARDTVEVQIQAALNRGGLLSYTGDVAPGDVLAAPYTDAQGTRVHRARVQRLLARDTVEVQIQAALNRGGLLSYTGDVAPGDVLAAPYTDAQGTRVHRARVQRLLARDTVEVQIQAALNRGGLLSYTGDVAPGDVLAAPYTDAQGTRVHRARVQRLLARDTVEVQIQAALNRGGLLSYTGDVAPGDVLAAPYTDAQGTRVHRARVQRLLARDTVEVQIQAALNRGGLLSYTGDVAPGDVLAAPYTDAQGTRVHRARVQRLLARDTVEVQIQAALNRGGLLSYTGDVAPGDVLAAPYTDAQGTRVHRARVQRLLARDTVEVQIQAALNRGGLLSYTGDVAPGDVLAAPYTDAQGTRVHRARVQRLLARDTVEVQIQAALNRGGLLSYTGDVAPGDVLAAPYTDAQGTRVHRARVQRLLARDTVEVQIQAALNRGGLLSYTGDVAPGDVLAAPYTDAQGTRVHRARVQRLLARDTVEVQIQAALNRGGLLSYTGDVAPGDVLAAPYTDAQGTRVHRARVQRLLARDTVEVQIQAALNRGGLLSYTGDVAPGDVLAAPYTDAQGTRVHRARVQRLLARDTVEVQIQAALNRGGLLSYTGDVAPGDVLAAPYTDAQGTRVHRARVQRLLARDTVEVQIQAALNRGGLLSYTGDVAPGDVLAAPYTDAQGTRVHRARVQRLLARDTVEVQIQAALNRGGLLSYTGDVAPGDVLAAPYTDAQGTRVHRARVQRLLARDTVEVQIQAALNRGGLLSYTGDVAPGDVLAAPYTDAQGTRVHRARVQRLLARDTVEIAYIDYGTFGRVNVSNLRALPAACRDAPPLAMPCALAELAPAPLLDAHAQWTPRAEKLFCELTQRSQLVGKIYSVAQGVVAIELFADGGRVSVNQELIRAGLAIAAEESYESKLNHDLRQSASELNMAQLRAYNREQTKFAYTELREVGPPDAKECYADVCLKGPFSPLEGTLHNLMYGSRDKAVHVEWSSINSVLLDTEPQRVYERLMVAAAVGQNELSSKLTLRHTTLLPVVPGLPAIIALLFCPSAELRRSSTGARYASALCGLGAGAGSAPHFPEHDLLVHVDADLDTDDVSQINHIRYLMDYTMLCRDGQDAPSLDDDARRKIPATIREVLLKLVMRRRKHREPESVPNAWEWNSVPEDELMEISQAELTECSVVYPLHVPQELYPVSREALLELKREVDQLHLLVGRSSISSSVERACPLCGTAPLPPHALRIHLHSTAHREKEEDFRVFDA